MTDSSIPGVVHIQIKYLNETKNVILSNFHQRLGYIQDELLHKFSLMIYNIEYTKLVHKNGELYFGISSENDSENTSYTSYFDTILENHHIQKENILYIQIEDRHRDENGNVIKNNKYIDNYNYFLTKKEEENYDQYFNTLIQEEDNYTPLGTIPHQPISSFNFTNQFGNELLRIFMNEIHREEDQEEESKEEEENKEEESKEEENKEEEGGEEENEDEIETPRIFQYASYEYRRNQNPNISQIEHQMLNMLNNPYETNYSRNRIHSMVGLNSLTSLLNMDLENEDVSNRRNSYQVRYLFENSIQSSFENSIFQNMGNIFQSLNIGNMEDIKVSLTEEEYNQIVTKKYSECSESQSCLTKDDHMNNSCCIICNDDFKDEDIVKITKCKHIIHDECLKPWLLKESKKCPVCRCELGEGKPHISIEEED
jgi:hypothetical protein